MDENIILSAKGLDLWYGPTQACLLYTSSQQIYSLPPLATRELLRMNLLELVDGLEPPTG